MKIIDGYWDYEEGDLLELHKRYKKRIQERFDAGFIPRSSKEYHIEDSQNLCHNIKEFIYKLQYDYDIIPNSLTDEDFIFMFEMDYGELSIQEKKEFIMMEKAGNFRVTEILGQAEIENIKKYLEQNNRYLRSKQ